MNKNNNFNNRSKYGIEKLAASIGESQVTGQRILARNSNTQDTVDLVKPVENQKPAKLTKIAAASLAFNTNSQTKQITRRNGPRSGVVKAYTPSQNYNKTLSNRDMVKAAAATQSIMQSSTKVNTSSPSSAKSYKIPKLTNSSTDINAGLNARKLINNNFANTVGQKQSMTAMAGKGQNIGPQPVSAY